MQPHETVYCPIRKEWVAALPEEYVRQRLLTHMIEGLGFPPSLIAVEKGLRQLPHLSIDDRRKIPDRRADIICFAKENAGSSLFPLLIIECKAIPLTSRVINQVLGYNHFVKSRFVAIVNQTELSMGWYDTRKSQYEFINYIPAYQDLIKAVLSNR